MERTRFFRRPVVWIVLVIIGALALSSLLTRGESYTKVDTSTLLAQVNSGSVKSAVIQDKEQTIELTLNSKQTFDKTETDKIQAQIPAFRSTRSSTSSTRPRLTGRSAELSTPRSPRTACCSACWSICCRSR